MKHTLPLKKSQAVELLGGSSAKAAVTLQYKGRAAVDKWPETLSFRDSLMVLGALWLQEHAHAEQSLAPRPARPVKRTRWLARRAA